MKFTLAIDCDNDAFTPQPHQEIARILRVAAARVETESVDCFLTIRDFNGNDVGRFGLKPDCYR